MIENKHGARIHRASQTGSSQVPLAEIEERREEAQARNATIQCRGGSWW
jgi:hypothetical protein